MIKFIKKLVEKIKAIFSTLSPGYKRALSIAVTVVDVIYQAVDNPATDFLVSLTSNKVDDAAVAWLRARLPDFLKQFKLFAEIADLTDPHEIVLKVSEILQAMDWADRNGERLKLATALAIEITADGKLDWADAVKIIQSIKDKSI
ncbi:hypothetical protein [Sphingobacterium multivorum]|uniref:hypothetical protein n=1 Tax=Sphingobacterium multivorum TaxID=28454 RepID=UPI003DA5F15B